MSATPERPIALFHEHPDWFRPLFAELERRGTPFVRIEAGAHGYDPDTVPPYSLVFNRMSRRRTCAARATPSSTPGAGWTGWSAPASA